MKVLVTGSTGLVGSALLRVLSDGGHIVDRLVRSSSVEEGGRGRGDPAGGILDPGGLGENEAVVHRAGENIAGAPWTPERKAGIRDSRVNGPRLLCESLHRLERPPETLVCASAVGYYGDRGNEVLREESPPGKGFLAGVCREGEEATGEAARKGVRVVNLRIGMVLSADGGALGKMLPAFRAGVGGRIGSGKQYASWIALSDLVGEMADELLLASARVDPAKLLASGYRFRFPELEGALRCLLGKG